MTFSVSVVAFDLSVESMLEYPGAVFETGPMCRWIVLDAK